MKKHVGTCPFCNQNVTPKVVEDNKIRRDVCVCPECDNRVLICRSPGCTNYVKGGDIYDDELCPSCTSGVANGFGEVLKYGSMVAAGALATAAIAKQIKDGG